MADWESLPAVDVVAKLPKTFHEQLSSKKWSERKEPLDEFANQMAANPKLDPKAQYGEVMSDLKLIISKDSNIQVVASAAKCVEYLALGLRKNFKIYVSMMFGVLLDKLKDKKPVVVNAVMPALEAIAKTVPFETLVDETLSVFSKPSPQLKIQTCQFVANTVRRMDMKTLNKKLLTQLLEPLAKALADSDPQVREASSSAVGACMKVVGEKPVIVLIGELAQDEAKMNRIRENCKQHTKEVATIEAEEAFERGEAEPGPSGDTPSDEEGHEGGGGGVAPVEMDPWDLLEPFDVLAKLPKDFEAQLEATKWSERKAALDQLIDQITAHPRLDPKAQYGEVVANLKRIIAKDSNIQVVASATKCVTGLATGLRKKFANFSTMLMSVLLEKFKEKKPVVVASLVEAVDALSKTVTHRAPLDSFADDIVEALGKTAPNIRIQTGLFLSRVLVTLNQQTLNKKLLKQLSEPLIKAVGDSDAEVRNAASAALGAAMKAVGEKAVLPLLAEIANDNLKMQKIKEYYDKVMKECGNDEVTSMVASVHKASPKAAGSAATSAVSSTPKPVVRKPVAGAPGAKRPASAVKKGASSAAAGKAIRPGSKPAPGVVTAPTGPNIPVESEMIVGRVLFGTDTEDLDEQAQLVIGPETLTLLGSAKWDERQTAINNITQKVKSFEDNQVPAQVIIRTVNKKKEAHFQVINSKFALYTSVAEGCVPSTLVVNVIILELLEKMGDSKHEKPAKEACHALVEACGMSFMFARVIEQFSSIKSPKSQSEVLLWMNDALVAFGSRGMQSQVIGLCELLVKPFAHSNPTVRDSALKLATQMYMQFGKSVKQFLDVNVKAASVTLIDKEFGEVDGKKPEAPTRFVRGIKASAAGGGGASGGDDGTCVDEEDDQPEQDDYERKVNEADSMPRKDISGEITPEIVAMLNDANWKVRVEGMEKVKQIITDAGFITPDLGDLTTCLAARLTESNKNLAQLALNMCSQLSAACGPRIQQHLRVIVPGVFQLMGDSKPAIRQLAVSTMNAFVEECGLKAILDGEMIPTALVKENPNLKVELYKWLAEKLMKSKKLPDQDLKATVPFLFKAIQDRNVDVRKSANEAVGAFCVVLGHDYMRKMVERQVNDNTTKATIQSLIDESRKAMPEPVVAEKPPPPPVTKASTPPTDKAVRSREPSKQGRRSVAPRAPSSTRKDHGIETAGQRLSRPVSRKDKPIMSEEETDKDKAQGRGVLTRARSLIRRVVEGTKTQIHSESVGVGKKEADESFDSTALIDTQQKYQRFVDEKSLKLIKWQFGTPTEDHIEQLKSQLATVCKPSLLTQLFNADFKQHLKALDTLMACTEACPAAVAGASDLLLKWTTLRFFDTNPSVLLKCLDFIQQLLGLLRDSNTELADPEAQAFIPFLLLKLGEQKDVVRSGCRSIVALICELYPASKVFTILQDGCKTKNSRQKAECLDQMALLIECHGMQVMTVVQQAMKAIAVCIGDRDKDVRNAALNAVLAAYTHIGDRVYKLCSNIGDKEMAMLEERIKRAGKRGIMRPSPSQPSISSTPSALVRPLAKQDGDVPSQNGDHMLNGGSDTTPRRGHSQTRHSNIPKPGMFQLEVDKLFPNEDDSPPYKRPDLTDLSDVIKMMREPIAYPTIKSRANKVRRTGSLSSVTSMDASIALDNVIGQVHSNTLPTCLQAVVQLEDLVKDPGKVVLMAGKVDTVLTALYFQLRVIYNKHMNDDSVDPHELTNLYQNICAMLLSLLQSDSLAREATEGPLKDLINQLITVLLDKRLTQIPEGNNIIRSINMLTVKLVDKADPTVIVVALLRLLRESLHSATANQKFLELVMKCIWKHCRRLPDITTELNVSRILVEAHHFYVDFPTETWTSTSDTPLRTVKTILNSLANSLGDRILDYCDLIERPQSSEAVSYIKKSLRDAAKKRQLPGQPDESSAAETSTASDQAQPNAQLTAVFKQIADKDKSKQGLQSLYKYRKSHPEDDIEPYLAKSSDYFQSYVRRQLEQIEVEEKERSLQLPDDIIQDTRQSTGGVDLDGAVISEPYVARLFKELQTLRVKAGMQPLNVIIKPSIDIDDPISESSSARGDENVDNSKSASRRTHKLSESMFSNDGDSPVVSAADAAKVKQDAGNVQIELDALRRRLELVKKGAL